MKIFGNAIKSGKDEKIRVRVNSGRQQGCQMFLGTTYQNGEKCTKWPQDIPNGHKIYQMAMK
jgi:hypothetical protein